MKLSRRAFLQSSVAGLGLALACVAQPVAAQDRFDQDALLAFEPLGAITLVHMGDLYGQMMPHFYRPAEVRLGAGDIGNLTGEAFRIRYGIGGGTPMDYVFTHENFSEYAGYYGQIGGLDRVATVLQAIRKARPGALFLTGALNGNVHAPLGQGVTEPLNRLSPDRPPPEGAFIERGGAKIALIPTTTESEITAQIEQAQAKGADLLVCLSQNGLGADQALARAHPALDLILSSASATALPEPLQVGSTQIIASGTQGRFVSRIDLDVQDRTIAAIRHRLIPIFAELIAPEPALASAISAARAPLAGELEEVLGQADRLLFTSGSLTSTWDDMICAALMDHYDSALALSPGYGWGNTILPGQKITREDLYAICGSANPLTYGTSMTGAALKELLETAATNAFHPEPDQQSAGPMPRVGGLSYHLDEGAAEGARITEMRLIKDQNLIDPAQRYQTAGWGAEMPPVGGAPLWQIVEEFIRKQGHIAVSKVSAVTYHSKN